MLGFLGMGEGGSANFIFVGVGFLAAAVEADTNHFPRHYQDHGQGGLSLRGVAVTTETATTAETAKTVTAASWYCILQDKTKRRTRCFPEPFQNRHGGYPP